MEEPIPLNTTTAVGGHGKDVETFQPSFVALDISWLRLRRQLTIHHRLLGLLLVVMSASSFSPACLVTQPQELGK